MDKIVVIKPLKKGRWSGFVRYKRCKDTIAPYLSPKGGVETGLDKETQTRLESEMGLPPGTLGRTSKFWQDYKIDMDDKAKFIYVDTPEGELAYNFILGHKRVANSLSTRTEWPYAEYVIEDVEEEAKQENIKSRRKIEALTRFNKMSNEDMRNLLKVVGKFHGEKTSNELIEKQVREMAENDHNRFLDILDDKRLEMRVFIEDLIRIKALRKNGTNIFYGDVPIGHDMETAIAYLNDPMNQPIKLQLKRQLEGSTKGGIDKNKKEKETAE